MVILTALYWELYQQNLLNIKILHIEAGLRSKNKMPEEINRTIVDNLSNYFVCPSDNSAKNLLT